MLFISSLRHYRPASVPHISITWNKWYRAWKSHACSSMEMRGQLSLRYQFWTDGLPWGAISPFQLKIWNSHCLNCHAKTHRWVLFASVSVWAFCFSSQVAHWPPADHYGCTGRLPAPSRLQKNRHSSSLVGCFLFRKINFKDRAGVILYFPFCQ